ncbi:MAG: hypothetical protein KC656_12620 [Myxococcales bacterium]|nr:hypothetical protein [Myxococcales bacterium]
MPIRFPDLYDDTGHHAQNLPLYCAVAFLLRQQFPLADVTALVAVPDDPVYQRPGATIPVAVRIPPAAFATSDLPPSTRLLVLAVYGGMLLANMDDPALGTSNDARGPNDLVIDVAVGEDGHALSVRIVPRFVQGFTRAVQTYTVNQRMFAKVLRYLEQVGEVPDALPGKDALSNVFAEQLAKATQRLVEQGVSADAPQLRLQIASCVDATAGSVCGDLPPL